MAKFPKFLICENPMAEYGTEYALHTQKPRFLAKFIEDDNSSQFEIVDEIDSFADYGPEKIAGLMRRLWDWRVSYIKWEEANSEIEKDDDPQIKHAVLEDSHAMSLLHSSSFTVPSNADITKIKLGDFVKVNASGERFWAKILFADQQKKIFHGKVDNDLVNSDAHGLRFGDNIKIEAHNIYQIQSP